MAMNLESKFIAVAIVAAVLIGTVNFSTTAFAGKAKDPNCFGEEASNLGGDLGEHSRDGGVAGDHPYDDDNKKGRTGIGNIDGAPGDLAEALNGDNNCETK
jgi:hypothetical protein